MENFTITLKSGRKIPVLGLGTWKSQPGQVLAAVEAAFECGYRHIDCAHAYKNQKEVGEAIQNKIKDKTITRESIFITDKLWNTFHDPKDVRPALEETLKNLQLDYLDLYLMHSPISFINNGENYPLDKDGKILSDDTDYVDTWKAMEELKRDGLVRDIGVSNFNEYQINRVLKEGSIPPAVNQVEVQPYFAQTKLINYCKEHDIAVTAYSPFGSPDRPWAKQGDTVLLENPKIIEIAKRLNKTPAQIVLKFLIGRGLVVIPKSVTPSRIASNFQVFDFELSSEDIQTLLDLNENARVCKGEIAVNVKYYPFKENYTE